MGSAPARAYSAWAALMCARAASCLQTSGTQKHCDLFLFPREWCDDMRPDLCLFPHLIYPAPHAGPVTSGPNLLPTPIPLAVLFSNQYISLFNSYLFLVLPLLLSCTSLSFFFIFIKIRHLLFPRRWILAGNPYGHG